jgi:hypothetical protein
MQARNIIKRSFLVLLLSFTFFAKDCHFGCSTASKPEDRLSYNKFSSGFPLPYFDLNIYGRESIEANGGLFQVLPIYPALLSIPINLLSMLGIFWLFTRFEKLNSIKAKILGRILFSLILIFDAFVFISYYPDILVGIAYWIYIFPMLGIAYIFDSNTGNTLLIATASRIYFVFLIAISYFVSLRIIEYRRSKNNN